MDGIVSERGAAREELVFGDGSGESQYGSLRALVSVRVGVSVMVDLTACTQPGKCLVTCAGTVWVSASALVRRLLLLNLSGTDVASCESRRQQGART